MKTPSSFSYAKQCVQCSTGNQLAAYMYTFAKNLSTFPTVCPRLTCWNKIKSPTNKCLDLNSTMGGGKSKCHRSAWKRSLFIYIIVLLASKKQTQRHCMSTEFHWLVQQEGEQELLRSMGWQSSSLEWSTANSKRMECHCMNNTT